MAKNREKDPPEVEEDDAPRARRKNGKPAPREGFFAGLKDETKRSIIGFLSFILGIFFLLAAAEKAGVVGRYLYRGFGALFGVGYFIIPILAFLVGISAFGEVRPRFALHAFLGSLLGFLSGIGALALIGASVSGSSHIGGIIGTGIAGSFTALFDVYASLIILFALVVVAVVIIFDAEIRFDGTRSLFATLRTKLFTRAPKVVENITPSEPTPAPTEPEPENEPAEEEPQKKSVLASLAKKAKITDEEVNDFAPTPTPHLTSAFTPPPLSLLEGDRGKPGIGDVKANANIIKRTLQNFGISVEMDEISIGPTVTRYALKPAEGVRLAKIVTLQHDLELALAASPIRIEAPIPGKSLVGVEIPNSARTTVGLRTLFESDEYQKSGKSLMLALGRGISGKLHFANLAKMPHLLIAGTTGSGKSVVIHVLVNSLIYRNPPEMLRFIMIDPKRVELTLYKNIPHLATPVITDAKKAILALKWAAKEMGRRYDILETEQVRDIESYHKNVVEPAFKKAEKTGADATDTLPDRMPYIVIIIDELADIMTTYPRELETAIVRLAQMSRAVGIHLILSTQRPSVNVITGLIKANIPARIALQVASQIDSRTILDASGAEKLLGAGDMLYISGEMSKPARVQSPFISEDEVKNVVKHIAKAFDGLPAEQISLTDGPGKDAIFESSLEDDGDGDDDELFERARQLVIETQQASTSYLQRRLSVGYSRAARLLDTLEERGVVGPANGSKGREVLEKLPPGMEERGTA